MACVEDGYYIEFMQEHISSLIVGDAIRLESFYSISFLWIQTKSLAIR